MTDDRVWHNAGRASGCELLLSYVPVQFVSEVLVNGVALASSAYVLQRGGWLVRVDGGVWPAPGDCAEATVRVTYTWGVPIVGPLWGSVGLAMGELYTELAQGMCGGVCKLPGRAVSVTRQGVTVDLADPSTDGPLLGLPLCDALILSENPAKVPTRARVYSPDLPRAAAPTPTSAPSATTIGGVSTVQLPDAYEGDAYLFNMTFPDDSYLAGAPGDVLAEIVVLPGDAVPVGAFVPTVSGATLTLTLDPVGLTPGTYWTDVEVGGVTYLRKTKFIVRSQVSS
jgi:hypothetical protein